MNHRPVSLGEFFPWHRERGEPLVLATVIRHVGSTYRKAGAQMLIAAGRQRSGTCSAAAAWKQISSNARDA